MFGCGRTPLRSLISETRGKGGGEVFGALKFPLHAKVLVKILKEGGGGGRKERPSAGWKSGGGLPNANLVTRAERKKGGELWLANPLRSAPSRE